MQLRTKLNLFTCLSIHSSILYIYIYIDRYIGRQGKYFKTHILKNLRNVSKFRQFIFKSSFKALF